MCLHAKHVFSNHFGWYLAFNCVITEKCMYFDNDPYMYGRGIDLSSIFQLDLGTVQIVWYYLFWYNCVYFIYCIYKCITLQLFVEIHRFHFCDIHLYTSIPVSCVDYDNILTIRIYMFAYWAISCTYIKIRHFQPYLKHV